MINRAVSIKTHPHKENKDLFCNIIIKGKTVTKPGNKKKADLHIVGLSIKEAEDLYSELNSALNREYNKRKELINNAKH